MPDAASTLDRYADTDNLARAQAIGLNPPARPEPVYRPGLSVAILTLNRPDLVEPLLQSFASARALFEARGLGFELLLGDTGSDHPDVLAAYDAIDPASGIRVIRGLRYHFSRCNNELLAQASGFDRLLLLNNDVLLGDPAPLLDMYDEFADESLGVLGLALDFPDGTVQHRGVAIIEGGDYHLMPYHAGAGEPARHAPGTMRATLAVTGAALMMRTDLWHRLGGLDENYAAECQDIDLCLEVRRLGYRVACFDAGPVVHLENATRPRGETYPTDRRLWLRRWQSFLESDLVWVPERLAVTP